MKMKKIVLTLSPALLKDKTIAAYAMKLALVWMKQRKMVFTEKVFTFPLDIEFTVVVDEKRVLVTAKAEKAYIWWRDNDEPVLLDKNFRPKPMVDWWSEPLPMSDFAAYQAYTEEDAQNPDTPPPAYPDGYTLVPAEGVNERVMLAMRRAALTAGYWPAILYTHQYALIDSTTGWAVAVGDQDYTSASINAYSPLLFMRTNGAYCKPLLSTGTPEDMYADGYKMPLYEVGAAHTLSVRDNGQVYNDSSYFSRPLDLCAKRVWTSVSTEQTAVMESWATYDPPACTWYSAYCHTHSEKRSSYAATNSKMEVVKEAPYYQYDKDKPAEIRKSYNYDYVLTYSTGPGTGGIVISPQEWTSQGKANIRRWDSEFEYVRDWAGTYVFREGFYNYSAGYIARQATGGQQYDFQLDAGPYFSRFTFAVGKHLWVTSSGIVNSGEGDAVDIDAASHFSPEFTEMYDDRRTTRIGYVRAEWTTPFERERLWDRYEGYNYETPYDHGWGFFDEAKQFPWEYDYKNSTCVIDIFEVGIGFVYTPGSASEWSSFYLDWQASYSDPTFGNTSPLDSLAIKKGFAAEGFGRNNGAGFLTEFTGDCYVRSPAEEQWARDLRYQFNKTGEMLVDKDEAQTEWNSTTGDWEYPAGYVPPAAPPDEEE